MSDKDVTPGDSPAPGPPTPADSPAASENRPATESPTAAKTSLCNRFWRGVTRDYLRIPRWLLVFAVLGVSIGGFLLDSFSICTVETVTEQDSSTETRTCGRPEVTDASVIAVALFALLMTAPDMGEIGVFGISLKRRLAAAEKEATDSKEKTERLEDRFILQSVRLDTLNQSVAAATAQANTTIYVGDASLRNAEANLEDKERAFKQGAKFAPSEETSEPPADPKLVSQLLRNWEIIAASLDLPPQRNRRTVDIPRIPVTAENANRFANVFSEELNIVRATRNTVAHAGTISPHELQTAVNISKRLLEILEGSGSSY